MNCWFSAPWTVPRGICGGKHRSNEAFDPAREPLIEVSLVSPLMTPFAALAAAMVASNILLGVIAFLRLGDSSLPLIDGSGVGGIAES